MKVLEFPQNGPEFLHPLFSTTGGTVGRIERGRFVQGQEKNGARCDKNVFD